MIAPARRLTRGAVTLATVVIVGQTFVAFGWLRPVEVRGDSMAPALRGGARVVVLRGRTPRRWDVVVLRSPEDARRRLVKRVVGLPGERIELRGGAVWADGRRLRNGGAAAGVYYGASGNPVWSLGRDEWFVAGDHQRVSVDSRHWGPAPGRLIEGVVLAR